MDGALQGLVGLAGLPFAAWLMGRRLGGPGAGAALRIAAVGIGLQLLVAGAMFAIPPLRAAFGWAAGLVQALQEATAAGTRLVFGHLAGGPPPYEVVAPANSFVLALNALPLILVVSALTRLLYRWGVLQRVVAGFAWALGRSMGVGGPVGTASAANIFVGMVEAPLLVRPYLAQLDRAGLFAVMTVGLATIAGTVLAVYAAILGERVPGAAGHLIVASVISAPAALMVARLMMAGGSPNAPAAPVFAGDETGSSMDAVTQGVREGIGLLVNVAAMLVVMVALVALLDMVLAALLGPLGIAADFAGIAGWLFAPLAWAIGVPWAEAGAAGALLGLKTVLNEFVAYLTMAGPAGEALSPRSALIMTYALSGFANFGSVGIMIGGLTALLPGRRAEIASLALLSMVSGTMATLLTGAVVGVLGGLLPWAI